MHGRPLFFSTQPSEEHQSVSSSQHPETNRHLNSHELFVLEELSQDGLTEEMLLNLNTDYFALTHCIALINLVRKRSFKIKEALAEIERLSYSQADYIYRGLTRDDVMMLTNASHLSALLSLKRKGLTAQMLLDRNENGHYAALKRLVWGRKFTIENALNEIEGVTSAQAEAIEQGVARALIL